MPPSERLSQMVEGVTTWQRQLNAELAALPESLRLFREASQNFARITKRLLDATEALEQFNALSTSQMTDARRRLDEATRFFKDQVAAAPGSERVSSAIEQLNSAFTAMAEMNPFLRRPERPKE